MEPDKPQTPQAPGNVEPEVKQDPEAVQNTIVLSPDSFKKIAKPKRPNLEVLRNADADDEQPENVQPEQKNNPPKRRGNIFVFPANPDPDNKTSDPDKNQ